MIISETKLRQIIRQSMLNEIEISQGVGYDDAGSGSGRSYRGGGGPASGPRNEKERLIYKCDQDRYPQNWPRDDEGQRLTNYGGPWDKECDDWVRGISKSKAKKPDTMIAILSFLDPTGITAWPSVSKSLSDYRSNPSNKNAALLALNGLSALPLIGKGGKLIKAKVYFDTAIKGKTKAERSASAVKHVKGFMGSSNSVTDAMLSGKSEADWIADLVKSGSFTKADAESFLKAAKWADNNGLVRKIHIANYYYKGAKESLLIHHIENDTLPKSYDAVKKELQKPYDQIKKKAEQEYERKKKATDKAVKAAKSIFS